MPDDFIPYRSKAATNCNQHKTYRVPGSLIKPTMQPFESQLSAQLHAHEWQSVTSAVAVSGGLDSIALLRGLVALRHPQARPLVVLHFNHRLRGELADRDAAFVAETADKLGLEFTIGAPLEDLAGQGDSLEAAARDARYRFFEETCNQIGARYLFMAHTADDQAETILHRILRGTGVDGLAGIPRVRPLSQLTTIVRPMLSLRRREGAKYIDALRQRYCEDETNADFYFTRNRLRHELLPALAADYNPQIHDALVRLGEMAGEASECVDMLVSTLSAQCVRRERGGVLLETTTLARQPSYLVRQLFVRLWQQQRWPLQAMTYEKWQQLAALAQAAGDATLNLPGDVRAKKQGEQLVLSRPA